MNSVKLFGSSRSAARLAKRNKKQKGKKPLKTLAVILTVILCLEGLYFFACYTNNSFVAYWRTAYINTALSTMRHQWMATKLLPKDVIQAVQEENAKVLEKFDDIDSASTWDVPVTEPPVVVPPQAPEEPSQIDVNVTQIPEEPAPPTKEELQALAKEAFYQTFWEVDPASMEEYLSQHPEALANGWENIDINEAGLDDQGTSIQSIFGEQVLAINAPQGVLLLRIEGSGYRGVLGVAKDPSRLCVKYTEAIGRYGQTCGDICEKNGVLLGITGSAFHDVDEYGNQGNGNGGTLAGYMMSEGYEYGDHYVNVGNNRWKRLELREDNRLYILDTSAPVGETCTDATEFQPAMIVDGNILVSDYWIETNPRACVGQTDKFEILMLSIEGRRPLEGILGTSVNVCAEKMKQHGCVQAMNMDGGTSGVLWYNGELVTRCSNAGLPEGRTIPNIWAYMPVGWEPKTTDAAQ